MQQLLLEMGSLYKYFIICRKRNKINFSAKILNADVNT